MSELGISVWVGIIVISLLLGLIVRCLMVIADILNETQKDQWLHLERICENTDTIPDKDDVNVGQHTQDMPQIFD